MRLDVACFLTALFGLCCGASARGPEVSQYEGLNVGNVEAKIVAAGANGTGHCPRLYNIRPATACPLRLTGPIKVQKNLILAFDYRMEIEDGFEGDYLGMSWFVDGEQWFWTSDEFSGRWRHAQVQIPKLRGSGDKVIRPGLEFSGVQIYGRVKETTEVRTATKARITVWFDNIRLYTGHPRRSLTERTRESYSNPPLFHWPKFEEEGNQRLQYSLKEDFPEGESVTVDAPYNFHTPGFVVIHDLVASSGEPAALDWMLHSVRPITTDPNTGRFSLECDRAALRGRFLSPAELNLSIETGFPVEPVNRYSTDPVPADKYFPEWILYAKPKRPTPQAEFLAAMQVQRLGEKSEPDALIEPVEAANAHGISISGPGGTHLVLLRKPETEGPLESETLHTDGTAAAIELSPDGKILRAFAADATFLRYKGEELFGGSKSQTWSMPE